MVNIMDKSTIASRAGKGFFKTYIKNIKLVEEREIKGHKEHWSEKDFTFEHKGKRYRVNEHIQPNKNGEVIYSAKYVYELIEL